MPLGCGRNLASTRWSLCRLSHSGSRELLVLLVASSVTGYLFWEFLKQKVFGLHTGPVLRMKSILLSFGGRGWKKDKNFLSLSALWNLGFGLFHIIYKVFFFFFLNSWLNCPGVLMTSKNYCFFKMVTLHVEVRNAFCRRRFAGKSIPTENELNKPNHSFGS